MRSKLLILFLVMFLVGTACAVPQTFNVNGKLTNTTGSALSGTYNMTFKLYESYTGGSAVWNNLDVDVTTDSSGIYNVILTDVNVSDSLQYYLGITVGNDSEMTPRINLTSSMYALRANVSDSLNVSNNYEIGNLTLGQKLTFAFGELIDNLVDGWLRVTGGLNVTGNFSVNASTFFVDSENQRVGVGTTAPQNTFNVIGDGNVTGTLYVLGVNVSSGTSNWNSNWSSYNTTWSSTYNATTNASLNNYIVDYVGVQNGSIVNYIGVVNTTRNNYIGVQNGSMVNYIGVVNTSVNNWITDNNNSVNNYILWVNSTAGGGYVPYSGATSNLDLGANNFSVDTSVFFVDSENDRVGIGTTSPTGKLHINASSGTALNTEGGHVIIDLSD